VFVLIGSYLLIVFVLPIALSAAVSYRALPQGRACPHCTGETIQLLAPRLRLLTAFSPFAALHRRWCLACGWEGTVRVARQRIERQQNRPLTAEPAGTAQTPATAPGTQTLDVRSLTVDGTPWRVMLQCWRNTDLYYGRFMFVAPTGRLWLDSIESFTGTNEHEVLGQALSLPDGTLEHRLRRLVSD
jgi:hypothetical protein